jgi:hypothetical protein
VGLRGDKLFLGRTYGYLCKTMAFFGPVVCGLSDDDRHGVL